MNSESCGIQSRYGLSSVENLMLPTAHNIVRAKQSNIDSAGCDATRFP